MESAMKKNELFIFFSKISLQKSQKGYLSTNSLKTYCFWIVFLFIFLVTSLGILNNKTKYTRSLFAQITHAGD